MADTGAIGGVLTDVALGYLEGLLKPSKADLDAERALKLEKAQEDIVLSRTQQRLNEAQAAYQLRRQSSTGRDRIKILTDEHNNQWSYNLDTGETKDTGLKRYARPLTPQQQFDMDQLSNIEKYFGKPHTEITPEEWNHPAVRDTVDLLRKRQVIYATPTGFALAKDIVGSTPGTPIRETPAQPPLGTPGTATEAQKPAPTAATPTPAPATKPASQQKPFVPGVSPSPSITDVTPDPMWLKHYTTRLKDLPIEQANEQWDLLSSANTKAENLTAFAVAYQQRYGKSPSRTQVQSPGTAQPSTTPTAPAPTPPTGSVPLRQTGPQVEKGNQERDAAQIKVDQETRAKNAALAGKVTDDQARLANDYFARKVPGFESPYYPLLGETQKKQINDDIQRPIIAERERKATLMQGKMRKEHADAMKLAMPFIQEMEAMDRTAELSGMVIDLLGRDTVSAGGKVSTAWNVLASWMPGYKTSFQKEAEKQLKAQGFSGKLDDAALKLMVTSLVEGKDETGVGRKLGPNVSKLEVLSSVLAYQHALTLKLMGGGGGRGVTVKDLEAAEELFNPKLWMTSPDILLARVQALQRFIQSARPRVKDMVRALHINPDDPKYPLLPYNPATAGELERPQTPGPQAPSEEDMNLLR